MMKKLQKLPTFNIPEPVITQTRKTTNKIALLGDSWNSKSELLNCLNAEIPNNASNLGYFIDAFDDLNICFSVPETDDEMKARIEKETQNKKEWYLKKQQHEKLVGILQEEFEKQKQKRDEKFKDAEYIEFLRLQKKMKEKGYV